jgi:NAD(P)H-nitrite reductase large subunit
VVLGSSAAGINGARELRRLDAHAEIVLISKDTQPYSRCILHYYVSGVRTKERLSFVEKDFEQRYALQYIRGNECVGVHPKEKQVVLADGRTISYDKLLIATGSSPAFFPVPGLAEAGNVIGFRNIEDAEILKAKAPGAKNIVIMGAGLVGADVLSGLLHLGKKPALVDIAPHLLSKQLDARAAGAYEAAFTSHGAAFYFNAGLKSVESGKDGNVASVTLHDGRTIPCDLLVMAAGVKANVGFLEGSGVETDKMGLLIDAAGRVTIGTAQSTDIFGAGDVTGRSPIWPAAVKQGIIAARNMCGIDACASDFFVSKATMNFEGIGTMSLGINEPPDDSYQTEIEDSGAVYKKIIHRDGKIYGALLQGDLSYSGILTGLIANKIDVSKVKKPLFTIDYSDFFRLKENFEFLQQE